MLEQYFVKPETVDRVRASWLGEAVERYVAWLTERKYRPRIVYNRVPLLLQFGDFAWERGARKLEDLPEHVSAFVNDRNVKRCHKRKSGRTHAVDNEVNGPVQQLLRLVLPGHMEGTGRGPYYGQPFSDQAPGFFVYLREERGLRENSLMSYGFHLRRLERYLRRIELLKLGALSPAILSAFVADCHGAGDTGKSGKRLSKSVMTGLCASLRVFLRYLHRERVISRDLSTAIDSPQHYRLSDIPRSISWEEVGQVLEEVDRRTCLGRRDYALLLLLVTYGLRSHEVATLTLDDIDWKRERLYVRERKAGHSTAYPLSQIVGEAILAYLQRGRPETKDRHIFFRVLAPYKALTGTALSNRATYYLRKAGIKVARPGSHTFRHTCVQRLVDADFPFKTIGDYVGHRSPSSTEVYTKVAVETLRAVALGDGEDIL